MTPEEPGPPLLTMFDLASAANAWTNWRGLELRAVTPHGSFTFGVTAVDKDAQGRLVMTLLPLEEKP